METVGETGMARAKVIWDVDALRAALAAQQAAFRQLMLSPYLRDEKAQSKQRADAISAHREAMRVAIEMVGGL
jgi:hypothetical protein